jgi:drug/metabolite transporter (DMT)-like permease
LIIALGWLLLNQKLMAGGQSPLAVTSWGLICGTGMLSVSVLVRAGLPPVTGIAPRVWIATAASGLLCTAASTLLWNWGMHRVPASRAGVFLNIEPAMGSLLGVVLMGDHLGPGAWLGAILIVAAVIVLTRAPQHVSPELLRDSV